MERGKTIVVVILLNLATLLIVSIPSLQANYQAASYQCMSSRSIVCLSPGFPPGRVTLATKFGKLVPLHDMAFLEFILFANGTMFFDVTSLAPTPDIALQFTTQSFGNGTFDIRFKGPSALGITADGASQVLSSAHGDWGDGVEVTYTNTVSSDLLVINYHGTGPGCYPFCNPAIPRWAQGLTIVLLLAVVNGVSLVTKKLLNRRPQKLEEPNPKPGIKT